MTGKAEAAATCSAKYCKGCGHYRGGNGTYCCEYLLDVGHRRPCPPGEGCTEHTKNAAAPRKKYVNPMAPAGKQRNGMPAQPAGTCGPARKPGHQPGTPAANRKIEPEKARELFDDGKKDAEIAAAFGASEVTVRRWRAEQGLIRKEKGKPGRPAKKPDYPAKVIEENEEDEIMEKRLDEAEATAEQKIEEVAEKAAELAAARFDELREKAAPPRGCLNMRAEKETKLKDEDGMTVEQLASLFGKLVEEGRGDGVRADGKPIKSVIVMLRYDAKNGDGPAGVKVELVV